MIIKNNSINHNRLMRRDWLRKTYITHKNKFNSMIIMMLDYISKLIRKGPNCLNLSIKLIKSADPNQFIM